MRLISFEFNEKLSKYHFKFDKVSFDFIGSHIMVDKFDIILSTSEDKFRNSRTGALLKRRTKKVQKEITKLVMKLINSEFDIKKLNSFDLILENYMGYKIILFSDEITTDNHLDNFDFVDFYDVKYVEFLDFEKKKITKIHNDVYGDYENFVLNFDKIKLEIFCCSKMIYKNETKFISYELREEFQEDKLKVLLLNKTIQSIKMYTAFVYRIECDDETFLYLFLDNRYKDFIYCILYLENLNCYLENYNGVPVLIKYINCKLKAWNSSYYFQSKYYDPEIGAFIFPDNVYYLDVENIGGLNLYTYCYNNPVMY